MLDIYLVKLLHDDTFLLCNPNLTTRGWHLVFRGGHYSFTKRPLTLVSNIRVCLSCSRTLQQVRCWVTAQVLCIYAFTVGFCMWVYDTKVEKRKITLNLQKKRHVYFKNEIMSYSYRCHTINSQSENVFGSISGSEGLLCSWMTGQSKFILCLKNKQQRFKIRRKGVTSKCASFQN